MFWKGRIALCNISSTDVSSCHVSSLSRAEQSKNGSGRDKEERRQEETSVELMSESAMRPFQNTKELFLTPFNHRDTAGGVLEGTQNLHPCLFVSSYQTRPDPGSDFFFNILKDLNEFCKTPKSERLTRTEEKLAHV